MDHALLDGNHEHRGRVYPVKVQHAVAQVKTSFSCIPAILAPIHEHASCSAAKVND